MTWDKIKAWIDALDAEQLSAGAEVLIDGKFIPITGFGINYGDGKTTKDRPHMTTNQEKNDD